MDKMPDISPGEKLLDIIRGSSDEPGGLTSPPPKTLVRGNRFGSPFTWAGPSKAGKDVVLGVEVGEQLIRMLKLTRAGGKPRTVECATFAVPEAGPDAPELSLVLRLALKEFLGKTEADIWALLPATSTELYFLTVPKMAKKQLSNAIFWTAKKEAGFDESAVVFDYEILGEVVEKGSPRLSVLAYTAARPEYERQRNLFMQAGYPLVGLTPQSAACRNLFTAGWLPSAEASVACLHLGEEQARLEIYGTRELRQVRVLKGGLAGMAQSLAETSVEAVTKARTADESRKDAGATSPFFASESGVIIESMASAAPPPSAPAGKGLSTEEARALIDSLIEGGPAFTPLPGVPAFSLQEIADMLRPAWERLARQMQMTLKHDTITLGNEQAAKLYLAGPHAANPSLRNYLEAHLGIECLPLDPLAQKNLSRLGASAPVLEQSERLAQALVLGLVSSRRETFNLLFTYKQKEEQARVAGLNRLVVTCWLALAAVCIGIYAWQHVQAYSKRATLAGLQANLDAFRPRVDSALLTNASAQVRRVVDNLRRFSGRNFAQAVLHDVSELTPENVRIFNIMLDLGSPSEQPLPPKDEPAPPPRPGTLAQVRPGLNTLFIDGFVKGDSQLLESILSAYLVRLRSSPLLSDVSVSKRSLEVSAEGEDVLRFTLACAVKR